MKGRQSQETLVGSDQLVWAKLNHLVLMKIKLRPQNLNIPAFKVGIIIKTSKSGC